MAFTSREFNHAAARLTGQQASIIDLLALPGSEDLDLPLPRHQELASAAGISLQELELGIQLMQRRDAPQGALLRSWLET